MKATEAFLILLVISGPSFSDAHAEATNIPPAVSILWPRWGDAFGVSTLIKIKADAVDLDGSIAQVQFFVQTNLIGIATNAPFNITWWVGDGVPIGLGGPWLLKAVATDNLGMKTESSPIRIIYFNGA